MGAVRKVSQIGIVGLGDQGRPIAMNLLASNWPLAFFVRRPDVRDAFRQRGARFLAPKDLARSSDLLLLVLVNAQQLSELLVRDGMLAAMRPGSIVAVHSTVSPGACRALAEHARAFGVCLIDAPVSGGRDRSYSGQLAIFAGGDPEAIDAAKPVFGAYASTVVRFGDVGAGQAAKLLNNYFYACHLATAGRMIDLIDALSIDRVAAAAALPKGSGSSAAFAIQAARGFERTRHDRGTAHAVAILESAVSGFRALAAGAGVDLGLMDQLAELGLRVESDRAAAEQQSSNKGQDHD